MTDKKHSTRSLTNLGTLMGCSRQNVKKLALALEKQGYVELILGGNNSVQVQFTGKAFEYEKEMEGRHAKTLQLLFEDFSDEEIKQFFHLYSKLYSGIERVENYAKELTENEKSEEE